MRSTFVLLSLALAAFAAPAGDSFETKLKDFTGEDDVSKLATSMKEQAEKIGMTKEQLLDSCKVNIELLELEGLEEYYMNSEMFEAAQIGPVKGNSTEEIIAGYKKRMPKTFEKLEKKKETIKTKIFPKLDEPSKKFIETTYSDSIAFLAQLTKMAEDDDRKKAASDMLALIKKIKSSYTALSNDSKNSLEKVFCIRSMLMTLLSEEPFTQIMPQLIEMANN